MSKARKQFVRYALIAVFVLLTLLLTIINGINFTMAGQDADKITFNLEKANGTFEPPALPDNTDSNPLIERGRMGPMGPDSPEMRSSIRYFTARISPDGTAELVAFQISAFTEEQACSLAESLSREHTGWTHFTYRYRVYRKDGVSYVTVIDQGRELLPSFRILIISVFGEILGLLSSYAFLVFIGKRLFRPLEEADRKQRQFLSEAENEFKVPLTVISADTEILEKTVGSSDATKSIRRQVKKMTSLIKQLGAFRIFESDKTDASVCSLSDILASEIDAASDRFTEKGLALRSDVAEQVTLTGSNDLLRRAVGEILENSLKFARTWVSLTLTREKERITLTAKNDTDPITDNIETVFDRFTRLSNAEGKPGNGLGLAYVKDIVLAHNGRLFVSLSEDKSVFTLTVTL